VFGGIWEEGRGNDSAYSRFLEWSEVDGSNAADSDGISVIPSKLD
jgi:hypothetical protein